MINCVIIDDEQLAIDVIERYVKKMPNLRLVGTATDALAGIELIRQHKAHLVFLDINLGEMTGWEVMELLGPAVKVVLCTAYPEFAVGSYDLDPVVDYLMKPIPVDRFRRAVYRAVDVLLDTAIEKAVQPVSYDYVFVKVAHKGKMVRIDLDEVDYIEGRSNYVAIYRGKEKLVTYSTMADLEEKLLQAGFVRIHKSYIVSTHRIVAIENNTVLLRGASEPIPLGEKFKPAFHDRMKGKFL